MLYSEDASFSEACETRCGTVHSLYVFAHGWRMLGLCFLGGVSPSSSVILRLSKTSFNERLFIRAGTWAMKGTPGVLPHGVKVLMVTAKGSRLSSSKLCSTSLGTSTDMSVYNHAASLQGCGFLCGHHTA